MWNGSVWHEATTFLSPPSAIIVKLNNRLSDALEEEDKKCS